MEHGDNVKSILKGSVSVVSNANLLKTAKFDEANVLETFHPANKDYGHMVIDEPKTPFVFSNDLPSADELDTSALMEKLRLAASAETPTFGIDGDSSDSSTDEDYPETMDEWVRRVEFERRRKLHYKEFLTVTVARSLIAEEFGDLSSTEVEDAHYERTSISEDSCSTKECPAPEESIVSSDESSTAQLAVDLAQSSDLLAEPEDQEPGSAVDHPCYHKLHAQISHADQQ